MRSCLVWLAHRIAKRLSCDEIGMEMSFIFLGKSGLLSGCFMYDLGSLPLSTLCGCYAIKDVVLKLKLNNVLDFF